MKDVSLSKILSHIFLKEQKQFTFLNLAFNTIIFFFIRRQ